MQSPASAAAASCKNSLLFSVLFPWEKPRVGLPYFDQWTTQALRGPLSYCRVKIRTWISSPDRLVPMNGLPVKEGWVWEGRTPSLPKRRHPCPVLHLSRAKFYCGWEPRSPLSQDACILLAVPKILCKQIPSVPTPSQPSLLSSDPPWRPHFLPLLSLQFPNTPQHWARVGGT